VRCKCEKAKEAVPEQVKDLDGPMRIPSRTLIADAGNYDGGNCLFGTLTLGGCPRCIKLGFIQVRCDGNRDIRIPRENNFSRRVLPISRDAEFSDLWRVSLDTAARVFLTLRGSNRDHFDIKIGVKSGRPACVSEFALQGEANSSPRKKAVFLRNLEIACDADLSVNPWSLIGFHQGQLPLSGFDLLMQSEISFQKDDRTYEGREKQHEREESYPASEFRNWVVMNEEPRVFFLWMPLFLAPGVVCGLVGFVLLFGPHRHPGFGATLYFLGMVLGVAGAFCAIRLG
jgi:hypothetical protein